MTKLKPATIKLLRQIKRKILNEPRQFYMGSFFSSLKHTRKVPNCGTAACIGGWGIALSLKMKPREARYVADDEGEAARKAIGITQPQSERLFYAGHWPTQFHPKKGEMNFDDSGTPQENAQIAARRIEYFIRTGGR